MMDAIVKSTEHAAARMDSCGLAGVVTGSTSGIGLGIACIVPDLGMDVIVRDVLLYAQPTRQFVTTEQIGALAAFPRIGVAASISGTPLSVDGGWTAQ